MFIFRYFFLFYTLVALIIPLVVVVACYIPIYIVSRRANKVGKICTLISNHKNYDMIYVKIAPKKMDLPIA